MGSSSTAVKVSRKQVIDLCESLGYSTAGKWNKSRMQRKIVEIAELAESGEMEVEDKKLQKLLQKLIDTKGAVEVVASGEEVEEPADQQEGDGEQPTGTDDDAGEDEDEDDEEEEQDEEEDEEGDEEEDEEEEQEDEEEDEETETEPEDDEENEPMTMKKKTKTAKTKTAKTKAKAKTAKAPKAKAKTAKAKEGGPSNKEVVYKQYLKASDGAKKEPKELAAKLLEKTGAEVKIGTIAGWVSAWNKGSNLPACAKNS